MSNANERNKNDTGFPFSDQATDPGSGSGKQERRPPLTTAPSLPAAIPTAIRGFPFPPTPKASDAFPLPLYLTNTIFFTLFFSVAYYLLHRWRDKICSSTPLHVVTDPLPRTGQNK